MIHLRTITLPEMQPDEAARFPFSVPAIRALAGTQLEFPTEVTFLVGENGSGKRHYWEPWPAPLVRSPWAAKARVATVPLRRCGGLGSG
ncbi:MAG: hypothetical protein ABIV47_22345 [Roseiflexaceae bacterium]